MFRSDDWIQELQLKEDMRRKNKLLPEDFYWENGKLVLTEHYHLRRGKCCDNDCKHCPYTKK
jgi:hypothetical protein